MMGVDELTVKVITDMAFDCGKINKEWLRN
jgi:hypothetical protein